MTFRTQSELENYLLQKTKNAMIKTQERVYQIIDRFVKEYYVEFTPEVYERTYQLYRSLVMSKIEFTGNGYKCYVYFDLDKLDYQEGYLKPFTYAAHGSHGGYKDGTAIWDDPMKIINTEAINTLKEMLISEGIPVK